MYRIGIIVFLLLSSAASAQDTLVHLKQVDIQGNAPQRNVQNTLKSLSTNHELSNKKVGELPVNNIAEAAQWLPGIYLNDYGGVGGLKTVSLRGLASNYTQVVLDGVPLSNVQTGQVDLGKFALNDLESIQLNVGVLGAELQSASAFLRPHVLSVNSAILDTNLTRVGLTSGAFGLINPSLDLHRSIKSKDRLGISLDGRKSNGRYNYLLINGVSEEWVERTSAGLTRFNSSLRWQHDISDSTQLSINVVSVLNNQELPGAVILYNPSSGQELQTREWIINADLLSVHSHKLKWKTQLIFNHQYLLYEDSLYRNSLSLLQQEYKVNTLTGVFSGAYYIKKHWKIAAASDVKVSSLDNNTIEVSRYEWVNHLGLSYHKSGLLVSSSISSQSIIDKQIDDRNQNNYFSPKLSIKYLPFRQLPIAVRMNAFFSQRYPTFQDLYYQRVFVPLETEKVRAAYIGLSGLSQSKRLQLSWNLDGFVNKVEDKIISLPTQNLFVWSTVNLGEVDIKGVEFSSEIFLPLDSLMSMTVGGSYSYQSAKDVTSLSSREFGNQIAYTPFEIAKLRSAITYKKWVLGWSMMYSGFRYSLGENIEANLLPSWWVHSIMFQKTLNWDEKGQWKFQVKLNNLMNEQYAYIKSFPMPGRHILGSIVVEL